MPLPDEPTEDETNRDGFLSYAGEWHALSFGVYHGMKTWRVRPKGLPENDDIQSEPHYYTGGYVIGTLLQLGIVLLLATVTL